MATYQSQTSGRLGLQRSKPRNGQTEASRNTSRPIKRQPKRK